MTVKLRSGVRPGEDSGFELAHRLVAEAGVAAIGFHPRSAAVHHKGEPDYELAARLVASLPAPVILTGGMDDADSVREAFARHRRRRRDARPRRARQPVAVRRAARARRGEPSRPTRARSSPSSTGRSTRAVEHLGEQRATRYLRKFYPWYVPRLRLDAGRARDLQESLQSAPTLARVRELLDAHCRRRACAVGARVAPRYA